MSTQRTKIGVALGGGTTRGMTHIGVLEALEENKIPIDFLVGCSSGAIVAAAFACGRLQELKEIVLDISRKRARRLLDFSFNGHGLIEGKRLESFFGFLTAHKNFEDLESIKLSFVTADALTGETITLNSGSIAEALEMTVAVPGFMPLKRYQGRIVIDGGAAMIVPAKVAYEMGADKVIGIDVSVRRSIITRMAGNIRRILKKSRLAKLTSPVFKIQERVKKIDEHHFLGKVKQIMKKIHLLDDYEKHDFNFVEIFLLALRITSSDQRRGLFQDDECDVAIRPQVLHVGRKDVSQMKEMIAEGRRATEAKVSQIKKLLG